MSAVRYAFVVTHDWEDEDAGYLADGETPRLKERSAPYQYGPRSATPDEVALAAKGELWRLLDDDGYPMAKGRMWTEDAPHWSDSEAAFAPLDDYGRGMFGATTLQYRFEGRWVDL